MASGTTAQERAALEQRVSQLRAIAERVEEDLLAARRLIEGILAGAGAPAEACTRSWVEWLRSAAACHDELVRIAETLDRTVSTT